MLKIEVLIVTGAPYPDKEILTYFTYHSNKMADNKCRIYQDVNFSLFLVTHLCYFPAILSCYSFPGE